MHLSSRRDKFFLYTKKASLLRSLFSYVGCPPPSHSRVLSPTQAFGSARSLLWAVSLQQKTSTGSFLLCYPYEGKKEVRSQGRKTCTSVLEEIISTLSNTKMLRFFGAFLLSLGEHRDKSLAGFSICC